MSSRLTLVTTCKPFQGRSTRIQRNALASWAAIEPRPEILVVGNEPGVAETCLALGLRQVPDVERTESGTPVLSGLVEVAEKEARGDWIALVNADIMLTSGLEAAAAETAAHFPRFLLTARRWNLDLEREWDFKRADWEATLVREARERGRLEPRFGGVDLFVFSRGAWGAEPLPPFAVGRGRWDSGILYQARARGIPVVEATERVFNVHQNHDYSHDPQHTETSVPQPDWLRNEELMGGEEFIFSSLNATHVLGRSGLRRHRVGHPVLWLRRLATAPASHRWLRPLAPAVRRVAPLWRLVRRVGSPGAADTATTAAPERATSPRPSPVTLSARPSQTFEVSPGGGVEDFDKEAALEINRARMGHLGSLGLPLEGRRVLDVGAGPGHLAQFFVERSCQVLCLEARERNVEWMQELYPDLEGRVFDVERDDFGALGDFEVLFSYGLLHHLENPWRAIQRMASVCTDLMLLSTIVADGRRPLVVMEEETAAYNQTPHQVGCRPTPSFVVMALRAAGFAHVYAPAEPPDHPDFRVDWRDDLASTRDGHPLRAVFIAARQPLDNDRLVSLLKAD
ncbi:MAG: class I SAM-dependent methyltransferase [Proteobacteria bacterium]|nr:class I SAM-dependent methyltransferase [Pseudomonadota bacterium]